MSSNFSLDDLRAVLGDIPAEPVVPDRAVAVRQRVRHVRQRRSALSAVALALPAVGLGVSRGGDGGGDGEPPPPPQLSTTANVPTVTPSNQPSVPGVLPSAQPQGQPTASSEEPAVAGSSKKNAPRRRPGPGLRVTLAATDTEVAVGEEVAFSVDWSDTDGHFQGYEMSYGDIGASNFNQVSCESKRVHPVNGGTQLSHAWSEPGTYRVYYTVQTGGCGAAVESDTAAVDVTVLPATDPTPDPDPEPPSEPEPTNPADSSPAPPPTTPDVAD